MFKKILIIQNRFRKVVENYMIFIIKNIQRLNIYAENFSVKNSFLKKNDDIWHLK